MIAAFVNWVVCFFVMAAVFIVGGITENCMTWAVRQRMTKGGTLLVRQSHFADELLSEEQKTGFGYWLAKRVPHFLWADKNGDVWQYTVKPAWQERWKGKPLFLAWLALWFYDGQVVQGDAELGAIFRK